MKDFFDEDGNIQNLKMEEWSRSWNGVKNTRRLDFELDIGNDRKIVIEYLEDHHAEELVNWNLYQSIRLVDILFGDKKDQIIHFAFIWDKSITDSYIKEKVKFIVSKIKDFHNKDNEKEYTINILNQEINNKKLSKILFESYFNENKPIIKLIDIFDLFKIKDTSRSKIIERFNSIVLQLKTEKDDNLFDDSESEDEEDKSEIVTYYQYINNITFLTNKGLALLLNVFQLEDFISVNNYRSSINFIDKIGKSAYNSACKIRDLVLKQKENIISGLDEI